MATVNQIQKGLTKFVDNHVAGAYSGVEKAIVLGGTTLLAASLPNILSAYSTNPIVSAMGLYSLETGFIDIDSIYNAFIPHLNGEKIPITLPKLGKIELGTIKLGKEEIDCLVKYIKEA